VHRLLRTAPRSETVAMFGERRVPALLQYLQHRLLNKAVQRARDGQRELHTNPVSLWDGLRSGILFTHVAGRASQYLRHGA